MPTKVDMIEVKGAEVAHEVLPLLSAWDIYLSYLFLKVFTSHSYSVQPVLA